MAKILVTGATGLVGYNIMQALLRREHDVRLLVRSVEKAQRLLPSTCEFVQGDITNKASLYPAFEGCDMVYHAAGFPEQWMRDNSIFQTVNVNGTRKMVDVALDVGVERFIYTSTIDVFKAAPGETYDESVIDNEPKGTFYERSKQDADVIVANALEKGLPAIFLHPSAVYGPGTLVAGSPGVNDLILRLYKGQVPALLPGGFPVVYGPDVGEGHVLAAEKAAIGERFILSERYLPLTDLAEIVYHELNIQKRMPMVMPLPVANMVASVGEVISNVIDKPPLIPRGQLTFLQWQAIPSSQKAQQQLGWQPRAFNDCVKPTYSFVKRIPTD
ncbi:MAG: NAD-dependent epimerase/dehydratase family protein [Pseudomonadales bacterium]|nr:NAD-dependent epimerase/dehydratase family protein [Pseudomonadales bacterium]